MAGLARISGNSVSTAYVSSNAAATTASAACRVDPTSTLTSRYATASYRSSANLFSSDVAHYTFLQPSPAAGLNSYTDAPACSVYLCQEHRHYTYTSSYAS